MQIGVVLRIIICDYPPPMCYVDYLKPWHAIHS